jgi:FkbM family methyltransferase
MGFVGRLNWYRSRFQVNNPIVGRAVELFGNRVRIDGMTFTVDCPQITTGHKSTLAFGLHELEERALIKRWLPSELPVLEFGGGLGVVSCLVNRRLDDPSRHIVVEANPQMIPALERNREINGREFRVINKALAYDCTHADLIIGREFVSSSTIRGAGGTTVKVTTTTVSSLMAEMGFGKAGIICDIEGAERELINREMAALGDRIQFFMAEMHPNIIGEDVVSDLLDDLMSMGFSLKQKIGDSVFFSRS